MRATGRQLFYESVPLLLVAVAAFAVFTGAAPRVPYWGDEGRYIYNTRYFDYLFRDRDIQRAEWGDNYWTHNHPKLTMYLLGGWLRARGYTQDHSPQPYDWSKGPDTNRAEGRVADRSILMEARAVMVALAVLTVVVLYLIARLMAGWVAGLVAAALALASPLTRPMLVTVQSDVPMLLFVLLALLAALIGVRGSRRGELRLGWAILLGLALGLALACKLTAVFSPLAIGLWGLLVTGLAAGRAVGPLGSRLRTAWQVGRGWLLALVVSVFVFVLSDPHLYSNPLAHTIHMLEHRRDEMDIQRRTLPRTATHSVEERLSYVFRGSLFRSTWSGANGYPLETGLAAIGFAGLTAAIWRGWRRDGQLWSEGLLLLTVLIYFFGISAGLLLAWSKYILPSFLLGTLLSGAGVAALLDCLKALSGLRFRAAVRRDVPA